MKITHNKAIRNKRIIIICTLLLIATGLTYGAINVYAKYYAARYNKGVAVASNLYFNSDKLTKSTGITDIDVILKDESSINKINIFTNSGSWSSGDLLLNFDIRNYDNNILYNEKNLNVGYKVDFVLLDEPIGAEYSVISQEGKSTPLKSKGSKVSLDGTTVGGSLDADTFGIQIRMTSQANYKAARVLVVAYPTSPDYVLRDKKDAQEYRLIGIFQGHPTDMQISIENAQFKVQEDANYNASTWKSKVEDLSGYIYNIKTAGDVVLDSNTATKQEAVVIWDNRYLSIDMYDENYQYALEHDAALADDSTADDKYIKVDGNTTSMTIMVLPYTSIDITFYKTENFNDELAAQAANSAKGKAWFESLVTAKIAD